MALSAQRRRPAHARAFLSHPCWEGGRASWAHTACRRVELCAWSLPSRTLRELRDWGARVHVGSGALTLSWENSSLTSSLPCFADGGAEVSGGPSSRPSCLCGTGCRAEPGSRSAHRPPALWSPGAHTVLAVSSGFPREGEGVRVSGSFCNSRPEDTLPWLSQPRDLPVGSTNTEPSGRALSASGLQDRPQPITLPLPRPSWVGCGVSESGACGFRMRPGAWWVG